MGRTISLDELAAEIERLKKAGSEDKSWMTRKEIAEHLGLSNGKSLQLLHELKAQNRLLENIVPRQSLGGKMTPHVCYQILPAPKSATPAKRKR